MVSEPTAPSKRQDAAILRKLHLLSFMRAIERLAARQPLELIRVARNLEQLASDPHPDPMQTAREEAYLNATRGSI